MLRILIFCIKNPATTNIYTLSLHDALPIFTRAKVSSGNNASSYDGRHRALVRTGRFLRVAEGGFHAADAANELLKLRRSEEHTSELQSRFDLVCRLLLEKKNRCTSNSR